MAMTNHPKPSIYILALGGTIACIADPEQNEFYARPSLSIEHLISLLPVDKENIEIHYEQLLQQISHEMTANELILVANRIDHLVNDPHIDGIVVVQGTNGIEETAYFINLTVNTSKPIIFTGSFYPANAKNFDGIRNLSNAIHLASNVRLQSFGVILTFNDCIVHAREAAKLNPSDNSNFAGNAFGIIGHIKDNEVLIQHTPQNKHTFKSEFSIKEIDKLPQVCIIYGHLGIDAMFVEAAIANKVAGIISAGMGKGHQPKMLTDGLIKASQRDIFVVRCSRTGQGNINRDPKLDDKYEFIAGDSLSAQKARILLSVALVRTTKKSEIQRIFWEY